MYHVHLYYLKPTDLERSKLKTIYYQEHSQVHVYNHARRNEKV